MLQKCHMRNSISKTTLKNSDVRNSISRQCCPVTIHAIHLEISMLNISMLLCCYVISNYQMLTHILRYQQKVSINYQVFHLQDTIPKYDLILQSNLSLIN